MPGLIKINVAATSSLATDGLAPTDIVTIQQYIKNLLVSRGYTNVSGYTQFDLNNPISSNIVPTTTFADINNGLQAAPTIPVGPYVGAPADLGRPYVAPAANAVPPGSGSLDTYRTTPGNPIPFNG